MNSSIICCSSSSKYVIILSLLEWMKDNRPKQEDVYKIIQSVHGWGCQHDDGSITEGAHGHGGVEKTIRLLKD